jgi:hypothetical protein
MKLSFLLSALMVVGCGQNPKTDQIKAADFISKPKTEDIKAEFNASIDSANKYNDYCGSVPVGSKLWDSFLAKEIFWVDSNERLLRRLQGRPIFKYNTK